MPETAALIITGKKKGLSRPVSGFQLDLHVQEGKGRAISVIFSNVYN